MTREEAENSTEIENAKADAQSAIQAETEAEIEAEILEEAEEITALHSAADSRIKELEEELEKVKDHLVRTLADSDNYRKRSERERSDASKYAVSGFAKELLGVADNLRRALDAIPEDKRAADELLNNIYIGVEVTEKQLLGAFEKAGIQKLEPMGEVFNPNFHEVMFEADMPESAPGTVIQVLETGYMIHDRLLRPARVGVAKRAIEDTPKVDEEA